MVALMFFIFIVLLFFLVVDERFLVYQDRDYVDHIVNLKNQIFAITINEKKIDI